MQRNSEWRKYARSHIVDGQIFWFHPSTPAQANYVGDFLRRHDDVVDENNLDWRAHSFYLLHGFLIDFESSDDDNVLSAYMESMNGLALSDAFDAHMSHPLLSEDVYTAIVTAYYATRDGSLQEVEKALDVNSDSDAVEVEKKEVA